MRRWMLVSVAVLGCGVGFVWPVAGSEPTLDELLELEPGRTGEDVTEEAEDAVDGLELDEDVRQMLRGEAAADAFEQAVRQMDGVARRLGRDLDPGLVTQREQESILAKLEQVIEAARQQQMSPQGGGGGGGEGQQSQAREQDAGAEDLAEQSPGGQQGQAGQGSQDGGTGENDGQASAGSVIDGERNQRPLDELRREWGQLPPRMRDEISEGLQERFSPAYRSLTEAYYRRLAEEE